MTKRNRLTARVHILAFKLGFDACDKQHYLEDNFGVTSCKELTEHQLEKAARLLDAQILQLNIAVDKKRKRLIAVIGQWLRINKRPENIDIIKSIACRAAKTTSLNDIPVDKITKLIHFFSKKTSFKALNQMLSELGFQTLDEL